MTSQEFTYWLQGFAELTDRPPDEAQWQSIKDHLALVLTKVTPTVGLLPGFQRPPGGQVLSADDRGLVRLTC